MNVFGATCVECLKLWINSIPFVEEQKHSNDGNKFHQKYRRDEHGRSKNLGASNY